MGFYFVVDQRRGLGVEYLDEVKGNSNIMIWDYYPDTLSTTDFALRITQTPKMKLMLTLLVTNEPDSLYRGITKNVFTNQTVRLDFLNHLKSDLEITQHGQYTHPPLINAVAYISLFEEWYTLMHQGYFGPGSLNWQLFDNLSYFEKRDAMKGYLTAMITDVKAVFPNIPVVIVENEWHGDPYSTYHAPANLDVLGLDAYFHQTTQNCDAEQRAIFDSQVTPKYNIAAAYYGKPMLMVGKAAPWVSEMPSTCQLGWYKELADNRGDVSTLLWWYYATVDGQPGARAYPVQKDYLFQMGRNVIENDVTVVIDIPAPNSVVGQGTRISGWAIDYSALTSAGIDSLHFYAYPDPFGGPPPVFLGTTSVSASRPDVAAIFGSQFEYSGYNLFLPSQTPMGGFTLVIFPHSSESGAFAYSRVALRHFIRQ